VGLGLLGYARAPVLLGLGVLLIATPHLIGAPRLDTYFGVAAPELAAHFVTRALGTAAVAWAILGAVAGAIWSASD
jgi:predicted cobalt transporter CbtA